MTANLLDPRMRAHDKRKDIIFKLIVRFCSVSISLFFTIYLTAVFDFNNRNSNDFIFNDI